MLVRGTHTARELRPSVSELKLSIKVVTHSHDFGSSLNLAVHNWFPHFGLSIRGLESSVARDQWSVAPNPQWSVVVVSGKKVVPLGWALLVPENELTGIISGKTFTVKSLPGRSLLLGNDDRKSFLLPVTGI